LKKHQKKELDRLIRESRLRNPQLRLAVLFVVVLAVIVGFLFFGPAREVSFQKVTVRGVNQMIETRGADVMLVLDTGNGTLSIPTKDPFGSIVVGSSICLKSFTGPILNILGSQQYTIEADIFCR